MVELLGANVLPVDDPIGPHLWEYPRMRVALARRDIRCADWPHRGGVPHDECQHRSVDLLPAERLLWTGSPVRFPLFDAADLVGVPVSIIWCGFAVFWEFIVIRTNGPSFLVLWGLMFVLFGLYMVAGRFVLRWLILRGTEYAVTDQRVVVRSSVLGVDRERSEYLPSLGPPTLRESANGAGTIRFGSSSGNLPMTFHMRWPAQKPGIQLVEIENARFVRDTIAEARARCR